ncbi:hypothetical protein COO20_11805 [Thalassospira marina]|uniref:Uncharacterized protein n=1 Tax=Thalassospira marina TaxID=2048283 RepID=A0A2N3KTC3_9PROT|nr:hypothetical protein COO20_11805 [Thalassospira marina]
MAGRLIFLCSFEVFSLLFFTVRSCLSVLDGMGFGQVSVIGGIEILRLCPVFWRIACVKHDADGE